MTAVMIDCREPCGNWKISRRIKEGCRIQSFRLGNLGRSNTSLTARQAKELVGRDRKPLSSTSVGDDGDGSKLHRRFSVSSVRLLRQLMIQFDRAGSMQACCLVPYLACSTAVLNTGRFSPRQGEAPFSIANSSPPFHAAIGESAFATKLALSRALKAVPAGWASGISLPVGHTGKGQEEAA